MSVCVYVSLCVGGLYVSSFMCLCVWGCVCV